MNIAFVIQITPIIQFIVNDNVVLNNGNDGPIYLIN